MTDDADDTTSGFSEIPFLDDLAPIPERKPAAPDDTSNPNNYQVPPHMTRAQRRGYRDHVAAQLKSEGCTCRQPFPKITITDPPPDAPPGAVGLQSKHESRCIWIQRVNGTNN